ncbi:hypothetical protein J6590_047734 [Homalodisca vitripennis]|nr:hypothetical protein J6590_047734 [Homalodisca vitripennis]
MTTSIRHFTVGLNNVKLTHAIEFPEPPDPSLTFDEEGPDGFPAYGLHPGSSVAVPYSDRFPPTFHPEFSITTTAKLKSPHGGFLFAVVDGTNKDHKNDHVKRGDSTWRLGSLASCCSASIIHALGVYQYTYSNFSVVAHCTLSSWEPDLDLSPPQQLAPTTQEDSVNY